VKKLAGLLLLMTPVCCLAQNSGVADDIRSLHTVLDQLYTDMLPLCSDMIDIGRGIAGFAAMWYIAARVWRHIINAEPIDFYPLFRPFVLGFAILVFPSVIAMINGVMQPTVTGTTAIVENSDKAIAALLKQKEEAIKKTIYWQMYVGQSGEGDYDKWYKYEFDEDVSEENWFESIGNGIRFMAAKYSYRIRNSIKEFIATWLKVLFEAASLCINTIRTFVLIVMTVLGPMVFGLAVFDGFQRTLMMWLARYVNAFLWLPVANIFGAIIGKIQENMLKIDIGQIEEYGDTLFSATDMAYMIFMIIGIIGYFAVPSVANYIVHVGGGGALLQKVNAGAMAAAGSGVSTTGKATEGALSTIGSGFAAAGNMADRLMGSPGNSAASPLENKLKGNS